MLTITLALLDTPAPYGNFDLLIRTSIFSKKGLKRPIKQLEQGA
jgi:hypothetical protein